MEKMNLADFPARLRKSSVGSVDVIADVPARQRTSTAAGSELIDGFQATEKTNTKTVCNFYYSAS